MDKKIGKKNIFSLFSRGEGDVFGNFGYEDQFLFEIRFEKMEERLKHEILYFQSHIVSQSQDSIDEKQKNCFVEVCITTEKHLEHEEEFTKKYKILQQKFDLQSGIFEQLLKKLKNLDKKYTFSKKMIDEFTTHLKSVIDNFKTKISNSVKKNEEIYKKYKFLKIKYRTQLEVIKLQKELIDMVYQENSNLVSN